jgi:sarcosine oxidase subunit beta
MGDLITIVGGGIVGASVAYHLSERTDSSIIVFERDTLGTETTAKSTAMLRLADQPELLRMKNYGFQVFNEFLAEREANTEYSKIGRFELATTPEEADDLQQVNAPVGTYIDGDDLDEQVIFPELRTQEVAGALYLPNAGYFRAVELTHEFAERAKANGVSFRTNTEVIDIHTEDHSVTAIETEAGVTSVSHVVAAAGPWNPQVGRMAGVKLPVRHTLAPILKLRPESPFPHVLPNLKHEETGCYFRGVVDGNVLVGHSPGSYDEAGTEYDPVTVDESVPPAIRSKQLDVIDQLLPTLLDAEVVEEWVGVRSRTPDARPIVGETNVDGFSICAFNSEGIQLSPSAGRCIAAQLTDEDPPAYASAVSPVRLEGHEDYHLL